MTVNEDSWVRTVNLPHPSLQDNTADCDRLVNFLKQHLSTNQIIIDIHTLRELPFQLRAWEYSLCCGVVKDPYADQWFLAGISNPRENPCFVGVAVDLGTSRVAFRLVDLSNGNILYDASFDNPQLQVGPDILTRIHACDQAGGLEKINQLIVDALNQQIQSACRSCGLDSTDIYFMTLAGNTCMTHLFMGLPPKWIIREPYIPVTNSPNVERASVYGLDINPAGCIFIFPNIGSYFGGDLIAGILHSGLNEQTDPAILIDVGTNAEVVLGNDSWLMACAGAAGPALEGGVAQIGMMAGPGVVDRVRIGSEPHTIQVGTIDDLPPMGICGSGMIDLAAQLFKAGMIDLRGRFISEACGQKLRHHADMPYLEVVTEKVSGTGRALKISQADLDSLIRSKAAMYTILETITGSVGMTLDELETFFVAGTFGAYIDPESAVTIGMLPDLPQGTYRSLGNSSLEGATQVLTTCESLNQIAQIKAKITYLELNVNQQFMNRFSAAKFLPHTDRSRFPSVEVG
jgi:uncharacterized 2Fe-2S/4Fe-4S cluster protein (DUF4445 family)